MKSQHYLRITRFMELAGQTVRTKPAIPTLEERKLRAKLILEEALETVEALGFDTCLNEPFPIGEAIEMGFITLLENEKGPNLVEIADGCADISVVTTGTMISCGFPDVELLRMIDESNLKKFGPGGHRREDGKWVKPSDWTPPDIKGWLSTL